MSHKLDIDSRLVQLSLDEKPLWSHLNPASRQPKLNPKWDKFVNYMIAVACFSWMGYSALQVWKNKGVLISPVGLAIVGVTMLVICTRFIKWRPWPDPAAKEAYQNAVITNHRVILYNHDGHRPIEIQKSDVLRAMLDYEFGGLVLKVYRRSAPEPAILMGSGTFKEALSIINQEYLST